MRSSQTVLVAGIVVCLAYATAAVLWVSPGDEALQRLAMLFALLGTTVAAMAAAMKSGEAASNTNGKLDARIEAAVHRANAARRRGDEPLTAGEVNELADRAQP